MRATWVCSTVIASAALVLVVVPSTANAAPPADGVADENVLVAVQSLAAEFEVGDHLAVRVTVTATQLIDGHVEVRSAAGRTTVRRDVEVAGGATEEFHLIVPSSQFGEARLDVELFDGDDSLDADRLSFRHDVGRDVVGVLPLLLARANEPPERVTLEGDVRRVDVTTLPVELMSLGAPAITQLDSIAASSDDLEALGPEARAALLAWIDHGGQLVLDDADELGSLPEPWRPTAAGYALAGRGEIRVVAGSLTSGEWATALHPAPLGGGDSPFGFGGMDVMLDPRITLAERAGVSLPNLTVIIAILGGYVLLVGPVLYLVLRRARRLTAAWIAIPGMAVVLAGAVAIIGSSWSTGGRPTSGTVLEVHTGGGYAHADLLVFSHSGGAEAVELPDGWTSSPQAPFGMFEGQPTADRTMVSNEDGGRIETRLEAGQIAVFNVEGGTSPGATSAGLSIEARTIDVRSVSGTVTNTSPVALRSVGVFVGDKGALLGDIAAGASTPFVVNGVADIPDPFSSPLGSVWPNPRFGQFGGRPEPDDSVVDLGIWTSFASRTPEGLYPIAHVRVAGWTDELGSGLDGDRTFADTTLVTGVAPVMSGDGPLRPAAVRSSFVESSFDPRTGQAGSPVVRYVVPPDAVDDGLELELPRGVFGVELLDAEGEWQDQESRTVNDGDDSSKDGDEVVDVPAGALRSGSLLVRFSLDASRQVDLSFIRPTLRGVSS